MGKLQRNKTFTLEMKSQNCYDVKNHNGELVYDSNENYEIYFKNAKFKPTGEIEAVYQGEGFDMLIDGFVRGVGFNQGTWNILDSTKAVINKAILVGVKNKVNTLVIIKSEKDDVIE